MATTLKDVTALIKTKIEGLKDGSGDVIFQNVYDYPKGDFETYPVAVIIPTLAEGGIVTTKQNKRTFKFDVSLYQENTPAGRTSEQATDAMITAIDSFILAFDQDKNLNYQVSYVQVVKIDFSFRAQQGPFIFAVFQVECEVVVQNY